MFRRNDGHGLINTAIRDGLHNRNAIGKVYWEEEDRYTSEQFDGLTEEQVLVLASASDVEDLEELVQDEDTGLLSGTLLKKYTDRGVRVENIAPEEFGITKNSRCIDTADVKYHRQEHDASQLRQLGLNPKQIEEAMKDGDEHSNLDSETTQRFEDVGGSFDGSESEVQEQARKTWVYEAYVNLDVDGLGFTRPWKIRYAGSVLIDKEPVDDHPFLVFTPIPRPHSFWGNNWAKKVIPTQNAKTILTRGILDHTVATNRPRYKVLKGTVNSAKELMDDRFGGIVNVTRLDGIEPIMQAPLNPYTFNTIQLLDQDKEDSTGVSSLMTGMNSDAVSKQNSFDMIDQLTTLSQTRLKMMARNFADQWIKKMYIKVYKLAVDNDDNETVLQLNGSYTPVNPSTWNDRKDFAVEIAVGYGEKEKQAQKWLTIDTVLTQQAMPGQYTAQQKFNVLSKALTFYGVTDVENFITSNPPPQEPDPFAVKEMELRERELAVKEGELRLKMADAGLKAEAEAFDQELKLTKQRADFALKSDAQDLKEEQHKAANEVAQRELAILEKDTTETRGIASPNS